MENRPDFSGISSSFSPLTAQKSHLLNNAFECAQSYSLKIVKCGGRRNRCREFKNLQVFTCSSSYRDLSVYNWVTGGLE